MVWTSNLSIERLSLRIAFSAASASWADTGGMWITVEENTFWNFFQQKQFSFELKVIIMYEHNFDVVAFELNNKQKYYQSIWTIYPFGKICIKYILVIFKQDLTFQWAWRFVCVCPYGKPVTQFRERILAVSSVAAIQKFSPVADCHTIAFEERRRISDNKSEWPRSVYCHCRSNHLFSTTQGLPGLYSSILM